MRPDVDAPALLDRLGIVYRRRGRALWACCPHRFHNADGRPEKEPSWSMVDEPGGDRNGLHRCHGCGRGGTPADLVAAVLGISDREARDWLRSGAFVRAGDIPPQVVVKVLSPRPPFRLPDGVNFNPIGEWPAPAREYLRRRGVTEAQAQRWGLGWACEGRLAFRIVIPVRDGVGRLRSFVARSFVERVGGREAKRYLEPREDDGADHAAILGEHLWPRTGRDVALLGEGWFDGAALERAGGLLGIGDRSPIAVLHGSPCPGQAGWDAIVGKLSTFRTLVVAVDPNDAGERLLATLRGALGRHTQVTPLRIPGVDVAAFAERHGDAALAERLGPRLGRGMLAA